MKGAAAASLYGARAGGGVINITTKSGRTAPEGVKLGIRTEFGQNDIPHEFAIAKQTAVTFDPSGNFYCAAVRSGGSECARYIDMQAEAKRINDVPTSYALLPQPFLNDFGIAANPARYRMLNLFQASTYPQTYDQVEQATKVDNWLSTNADLRGKVRNTGFFASVSHATQAGAFQYLNGYQRNSGRLNVDQLVGSKLSLQGTSFYATSKADGANQEGGTGFFRLSRSPAFVNQGLTDAQGRLYIRSDPLNQGARTPIRSTTCSSTTAPISARGSSAAYRGGTRRLIGWTSTAISLTTAARAIRRGSRTAASGRPTSIRRPPTDSSRINPAIRAR